MVHGSVGQEDGATPGSHRVKIVNRGSFSVPDPAPLCACHPREVRYKWIGA